MTATENSLTEELCELKEQLRLLQVAPLTEQATYSQQHVQVNIPKFNKANPDLWFAQSERLFTLNNVVADGRKFDLVSVLLEADIARAVEDLLLKPPKSDKYNALKQRLLDKFAESNDSKLRRLLHGGDMTGKKPTEILAHMRRLAPSTGCESILRTLFIAELPKNIRPLISVWEDKDLDKLAKMADKILETSDTDSAYAMSAVVSLPEQKRQEVDAINSKKLDVIDVALTLRSLSEKVDKLSEEVRYCRKSTFSRSQNGNEGSDKKSLCYYHTKFGDNARKCQPNCKCFQQLN
ncbi:uncharacterized protein LOC118734944 [Rhagoletis pomonella]|uniref:uncharacterized protein LOC118734944 n=1 Tax=Rhagoletis pomonella TaxID=28610 RepID=UPI00177BC2E6|nr:uncharacterized protein LOC118734944 [Rhagoletis pomonella]